jgi:NDP-sugar pyrophosphorylase family protein
MSTVGVVLAGGQGRRLGDLTEHRNKGMVRLLENDRPGSGIPMIMWPIDNLRKLGITDFCVVVGPENSEEMMRYLSTPLIRRNFGNFVFACQDQPRGEVDAFRVATPFIRGSEVVVTYCDFITSKPLLYPGRNVLDFNLFVSKVESLEYSLYDCLFVCEDTSIRFRSKKDHGYLNFEHFAMLGQFWLYGTQNEHEDFCQKSMLDSSIADALCSKHTSSNGTVMDVIMNDVGSIQWADAGTPEGLAKANEIAKIRRVVV